MKERGNSTPPVPQGFEELDEEIDMREGFDIVHGRGQDRCDRQHIDREEPRELYTMPEIAQYVEVAEAVLEADKLYKLIATPPEMIRSL